MIKYEPAVSHFFEDNKNYCEKIASELKTINLDCSGFCNSYGYDINTTLNKNSLIYNLKFHKDQTTQNGVIIPVDANDYAGTELNVTGLNKKFSMTFGKSSLRRFFILKMFKRKIPNPYFIKFNYLPESNFIDNLVKKILDNKISKLKLNNRTLVCIMHIPIIDPLKLIADIDTVIKDWV